MVISAPTGSGKTVLFELCILRLLSRFISAEGRFIHIKGTLKTVYIAPSKALVQEKLRDWNQKLGKLGINCLELTGDNASYNIRNIQEADIIVTTPEKFDAVTRYHFKDGGLSFFSDIALVLIDEVHLLNDPRGAALEAIVSRIKMLSRKPEMKSSALASVRLLAVSATIPNISDLAEWLMVPIQGIKRFGEEMRPVKLTTKVFDVLMQYSRGKSALVFCSTRKGAQEAAQRLSQTAMTFGHSNPFIRDREQQDRLREASLSCSDKQMQSYILYGIGFHNGGLCQKDRSLIEGLFLRGDLQVLCTTNTLAHGINLPAHTVPGRLMTKYYLRFNTMKNMMQAPADCSVEAALHIVCRIQLRRNEKKLLSDANTDKDGRLRFHILGEKGKRKKRIQTREEKIFVLANDCLTGDPSLHDLSMNQDMISICSNGCRIAKCMREYFIYRKNYKGALNSSLLAKSLHQKLWDDSPFLLKQLPGIGMVTAKGLHSMGVKTFETLYEADPRKIEIVTGRKYPFGNHIKESLLSLPPKIEMKLEETQCERQGKFKLVVTLTRLSQAAQSTKRHYADMPVQYLYSGVNASARKDDC
ncbi:DNA helicase [Sarracenia purpurea var. burkii]